MRKTMCALWAAVIMFGAAQSARAQTLPNAAEWTAFRLAYAKKPGANLLWRGDKERQALFPLQETNKEEFVKRAEAWLSKCPIDAEAHFLISATLAELGRDADVYRHRYAFYGLTHSVFASGDGKTMATAYKVVAIDEEYLLFKITGRKFVQQSLRSHYDVMQVTRDGKPETIYFDVTIPLQYESGIPWPEKKAKQ